MKSINLADKLSLFSEHFKPRTVGQSTVTTSWLNVGVQPIFTRSDPEELVRCRC
jgi:hypothetical protein